jgi:hypothetical protein
MIEKLEHGALLRSFPLAASITGAPPDPIRALAGLTNACTVCSALRDVNHCAWGSPLFVSLRIRCGATGPHSNLRPARRHLRLGSADHETNRDVAASRVRVRA